MQPTIQIVQIKLQTILQTSRVKPEGLSYPLDYDPEGGDPDSAG